MLLLKIFAPWLLVAFIGQQVSLSSGARNKNHGNKLAASGRGKFSKDKMQCTWGAKDVGDTVKISVKCEDPAARIKGGVTDLQCEYNGKAQRCPGYRSDNKGFWKQVARAFKRLQGKVCKDDRALVRAGMCKRAPRDTHFKLDIQSSVVSAQSGGEETPQPAPPSSNSTAAAPVAPTVCAERANHWNTAKESCSGSWASVCNFFLSMLQSNDC